MKASAILAIVSMAYKLILRDLLVKAISDPNEEWDDIVLSICDSIFNYKP